MKAGVPNLLGLESSLGRLLPPGFGLSDTAFRVFILMASRRLKSDRFFTTDFTPEVYTQTGIDWVNKTKMKDVILRHYPELETVIPRPVARRPIHSQALAGRRIDRLPGENAGCFRAQA